MNKRGYSSVEIVAIVVIVVLIVALSLIYMKQSSDDALTSDAKERVKAETAKIIETISKDITRAKQGSMEITPIGKNKAKISFLVLQKNELVQVSYFFEKPNLSRKEPGKPEVKQSNIISGLKINEDYSSGEMELEVAVLISSGLEKPIGFSDRVYLRMLSEVPAGVKIVHDDGNENTGAEAVKDEKSPDAKLNLASSASAAKGDQKEKSPENVLEEELFDQYIKQGIIELKKKKVSLEYELEMLKKKEAAINRELLVNAPGMLNETYQLVLPEVSDVAILDDASKKAGVDSGYVEKIRSKMDLMIAKTRYIKELRVVSTVLSGKDSAPSSEKTTAPAVKPEKDKPIVNKGK
ncbi:MAG: hypothetical protein QMC67_15135 [Candidatus Wallbacteria bacterium]